jgi:hypothetical protein
VTPEQAEFLTRPESLPALEYVAELVRTGTPELSIRKTLETQYTPQECRAILDCVTCRVRYQDKFWRASDWLLTRTAAEQASDSRVASWRAKDLKRLVPGHPLTELGCGIGGDTVFLSREFPVLAYEQDRARALLATHNLSHLGRAEESVVKNLPGDLGKLRGAILFCDPARRSEQRLSHPEEWQPPLSEVVRCYTEKRFQVVAIKVAPGIKRQVLEGLNCPLSLTFLSINSDLKEAFIVLGGTTADVVPTPSRAVLLGRNEPIILSPNHIPLDRVEPAPGHFLHNPDPAILRAEALDTLGHRLRAGMVHPKIGYLVGEKACQDAAATSFRIIETLPLNWNSLKKRLQAMNWTEYEYLGRGVPFSQAEVRKKLPRLKTRKRSQSACRGSLIIYRDDEDYRVVLALRSTEPNSQSSSQKTSEQQRLRPKGARPLQQRSRHHAPIEDF